MNATTRLYIVQREHSCDVWARIWITDDGCFTTISDHGNYGYWWGSPGCEFRQFLCNCDDHYLTSKLAAGRREWDEDATRDAIRKGIQHLHAEGEDTREESDLLDEADLESEAGFVRWLDAPGESGERLSRLIDMAYGAGLACFQPPVQLQMFIKHIWPRFVAILKAELEAEKNLNTSAGVFDAESSLGRL
jgi:hypothetical protein